MTAIYPDSASGLPLPPLRYFTPIARSNPQLEHTLVNLIATQHPRVHHVQPAIHIILQLCPIPAQVSHLHSLGEQL
jgi:hypothetical protein